MLEPRFDQGRQVLRCAERCGAYAAPQTSDEIAATLEHWRAHRIPTHQDVLAGRWDGAEQRFVGEGGGLSPGLLH